MLVVNATIDMNQVQDPSYGRKFDSICTKAYVSVFDDFNGTLNNVTVIGFINITGSTVAKTLYLSRLFGGVPQVSGRAAFFTANVINTSSNLQFYVSGTQITTATNTVAQTVGVNTVYNGYCTDYNDGSFSNNGEYSPTTTTTATISSMQGSKIWLLGGTAQNYYDKQANATVLLNVYVGAANTS